MTVKVSRAGTVCFYSQAATHVVPDVAGYTTAVSEPSIVATVV